MNDEQKFNDGQYDVQSDMEGQAGAESQTGTEGWQDLSSQAVTENQAGTNDQTGSVNQAGTIDQTGSVNGAGANDQTGSVNGAGANDQTNSVNKTETENPYGYNNQINSGSWTNSGNQSQADSQNYGGSWQSGAANSNAQNQHSENRYSENQHSENQHSENRYSENQHSENQHSENRYSENQYSQNQYTQNQNSGNYGGGWQNNPAGGDNNNSPKKGGFGKTLLKIAAGAAVFGLVAGGIFYGIDRISEILADNIVSSSEADTKNTLEKAEDNKTSVKEEAEDGSEKETEETLPGTGTMIESTAVLSEEDGNMTDLSDIVKDVMPSIVAVNSTIPYSENIYGYYYSDGESESSGSGVIYGADEENLYIVTNNHVIEGASSVKITFIDKATVDATIKGSDSDVDLAVLAIKLKDIEEETKDAIKQITIGSSDDIQVGEMVIAIGNALGYGQSMTAGYISAKDRTVTLSDTGVTMTLIQTDAAINPGNSGGALLNMKGELIGITNVKYATTDVEGMGFAIPISNATSIIKELQETEELEDDEKGYLGITCEEVTQEQNKVYNIPVGVYVIETAKGGAADKAGIMSGDIITKVNGTQVETRSALQNRITSKKVGTIITITYQRSESGAYVEHEAEVKLQGQESLNSITEDADEDNSGSKNGGNNGNSGNTSPYNDDYYDDFEDFYDDFFNYYYNR